MKKEKGRAQPGCVRTFQPIKKPNLRLCLVVLVFFGIFRIVVVGILLGVFLIAFIGILGILYVDVTAFAIGTIIFIAEDIGERIRVARAADLSDHGIGDQRDSG